jgi:uncharacterized membrane protein
MPDAVAAPAARSRIVVLVLFAALAGCAAWAIVRGTSATLERTFLAGLLLLPLALPLPGLWRNDRRTYAWATLCLTPHVIYGIMEAIANPPLRVIATSLLLLALSALAALIAHLRLTRPRSG